MKYLQIFLLIGLLGVLYSCGGDDDICESGEGTPRMKVMFKSAALDKEITLASLYVSVDYGSGKVNLGETRNSVSRLIPLRVDDSPYTDIYFKETENGNESHVRINYNTKSTYVSPGCGVKKTYENITSELIQSSPVVELELGQNYIENEDKTNLYLLF